MLHLFSTSRLWKATLGLLVASVLFTHGEAKAMQLQGSLALAGFNVHSDKPNLAPLNQKITSSFLLTSNTGTGAFAYIPLLTIFTATTLDLANLTTFSFSNATWGAFVANQPSFANQVLQHTTNFLDILLDGTFTPGPGFLVHHPYDPSEETVRLSFNQSGSGRTRSISEAITLDSPPQVPEPGTLLLLGSGMAGLVLASRRKNRQ
jgi:uncharacterized membrane protein YphA (DoxX/SURF4 family)